jgi:hypothetical protein
MNNVIQFPPMIKQQVFDRLPQAKAYAQAMMLNDVYQTASIADTDDGRYVVTVYPVDELMRKAVENNKREWCV